MEKKYFSFRAILVVITVKPFLLRRQDSKEVDELLVFLKSNTPTKSALLVSTHLIKLYPFFETSFFKKELDEIEKLIKVVGDPELKTLLTTTWIERHAARIGHMLEVSQMPHCVAQK